MKNNRRMHRAWSMILCCVLLLGLLPTTTLAVERDAMDQAIETVSIRINPPSPGSSLSYQATPGDSNYYTVNSVKWYDHTAGSYVQSGTLAVDGHEYVVEITVSTVSDNYCFRQGYVRGVVNDNYGTAETTYAYDSEVVVKYRFAVKTEPVHNIYVDDIDVPRPGCTPDYEPDMDAANHTVSGTNEGNFTDGVYWYDLTNSKTLKPTDTFKEGNKYRIFVDVVPRSGYYFIVNAQGTILTKAYVNREAANVMQYLKEDTQKRLNVYYDFVCEYDEISSVGITGLDAPAEGKTPDYSVKLAGTEYTLKTTSASNPYVVSGVNWYDETAGSDLTATAKFIGGHTYTATVYLVPDTGCRFTGSVSGKINGNTATVSGNGSEIQVKYTFPALATNQITTVAIEGITAPATGAAPSYVAIVKGEGYSLKARNDAYYKNGICWSIMESSDLPVSGGTTFEGGQKYQITMYLVAEEGYEFSATAGGALNVKATINGKTVAEVMGNKKEIVVTYYFTEATADAKITSAAVTGIDAPVVGASPDYTADIADTRYALEGSNGVREKNGITWINNKTGNAMVVGADKFEAGVSYSVVVGVIAKDGYAFQTDRLNAPQITGSINGELVDVSGQDEYTAYLTYTFEALAEKKTLSSIAITTAPDKTEYKTGDTFDPTGMVVTATYADKTTAAVTGYIFTPNGKLATNNGSVTISYTEGNVTKTATQTIKVTQAKTPASLAVTTAPAKTSYIAGESFSSAGMVVSVTYSDKSTAAVTGYTVTPSKLTAETNSVTISYTENEKTVYAEQAVTVKAAINPFSDIKESDYFHDPVLWAVSNGVTKGTSATTFSPNAPCTRAQMATFLWRAAGSPDPVGSSNPFKDVPENAYYAKAVQWAYEQGITGGTSATTFSPDADCTRAQMAAFLCRMAGGKAASSTIAFTDVSADAYYAESVQWAVENGITLGTGDGTTFSPNEICTRAQMVTFLYRFFVK